MPTISDDLIDTHRDINLHSEWWDAVYDDFFHICTILGIDLAPREPCFSGFCSQGDGASWTGLWGGDTSTSDAIEQAPIRIREYAPLDETLHKIADTRCMLDRVYFRSVADIHRFGSAHYVHSGTMYADISPFDLSDDELEERFAEPVVDYVVETVQSLARELAEWLYVHLETEYEYLTSDEAVRETLIANDMYDEPEVIRPV